MFLAKEEIAIMGPYELRGQVRPSVVRQVQGILYLSSLCIVNNEMVITLVGSVHFMPIRNQ